MREVTPKELREYNEKSFKETQKIFRRRLREIAAGGITHAEYQPKNYKCGEQIKPWLESLGFKVKEIGPSWCRITWPEEEDILERLRRETAETLAQPIKFTWGVHVERPEGTWKRDYEQFDYFCSECEKHAEYVSDYCPNCGKRMKPLDGNRY